MLLQVIVWQILHRERTKWHYAELLPLENNLRPENLFPKSLVKCHSARKAKSRGTPQTNYRRGKSILSAAIKCHPLDNKSLG
mmetsp:Transcript_22873/g.52517  ORF Transcript_22873/g.52517 Transcript_22873/m.52517 type:complete len:82 (-) Transcript_22873:56-301(-)